MPRITGYWLLGVLVVTVGCSRTAQNYLERGNKLFRDGKFADAEIQYRNAVQKNSGIGEAWLRLGMAQLRLNNAPEAYRAFVKALELMPSSEEARVQMADLDLLAWLNDRHHSQKFYTQFTVLTSEILKNNPTSVDGLRLQGDLALLDHQPGKAVESYRKADALRPGQLRIVQGLAEALFQANQAAEGEGVALAFLDKQKNAGSMYDILYQQYIESGRETDAENLLKRKIENNPGDISYHLQLARHYSRFNKPAQMTAVIHSLLNGPKQSADGILAIGDFYSSLGKQDDALRIFQGGIHDFPKSTVAFQKKTAATLLAQGKRDEAGKVVDSILQVQPQDIEARTARARLLLESGKPQDLDRALSEFQALVKQRPDDALLRYDFGRAWLRKGNAEGARTEWHQAAIAQPKFLPPQVALAALDLSQERFREAREVSESLLVQDANDPEARLLNAAALAGQGAHDDAEVELRGLIREFPRWVDPQLQLGILSLRQNRLKEAEDIFTKLRSGAPTDFRAAAGLAEVYSTEKQYDAALQLLEAQWKKSPDSAVIGDLVAGTALRAGKQDVAIAAYRKRIETSPKSIGTLRSLSELYVTTGNPAEATETAEKWRQLAPNDAKPEILLAIASRQAGRPEDLKAHLKRASELKSEDPYVLNSMAYLMAESGGNLDDAFKLVQQAIQRTKGDPHFVDTMGWIYLKQNNANSALQIFSNLSSRFPADPAFHYHRGAALAAVGQNEKARAELKTALADRPDPADKGKIDALLATLR